MSAEVTIAFEDDNARKFFERLTKKVKAVTMKERSYVELLSAIVLRDINNHFIRQEGPRGPWQPWSKAYAKQARARGQRMILSRKGVLRKGWIPTNMRRTSEGILWYNPIKYGPKHDKGLDGMPRRQFAWLSEKAKEEIAKKTAKFLVDN